MKNNCFTKGLNFYKLFWIFVIGCLFGSIYEMLLEFIKSGTWQNRSALIYGPFNLVYGLGAVLFMISLYRVRNLWVVFILGTFLGGFFEYMISWLQEIIFHTTSWDYSNHFLNFDGRTSLFVAIGWGILSVVFIKWIAPFFDRWIDRIPRRPGLLITWFVLLFFVFNITVTTLAVWRETNRSDGIEARNDLEQFLDEHFPDSRLEKIFPNKKEKD